ncbi:MAG: CHAP domain-containing protein, partial [Candidatus Aureabacteria bacterium]|nr:CHAP domain-containing protein [Candidatus Auribacterota bacterium]
MVLLLTGSILGILLRAALCGDDWCCNEYSPGNPYLCYGGGNCPWWAWKKAADSGTELPAWGNAKNWWPGAQQDGYATGSDPRGGSVFCMPDLSSNGHVGWVEWVEGDGSTFHTTEMAYGSGKCLYTATRTAGDVSAYGGGFIYISSTPPTPSPDTPTPIPPPSAPNPSIQWLDQGLNSGDGQKVKVTCGMPGNATELLYDMEGAGTNDYGWTGATSYTDTGVYDEQTVSVRCKARGPGGESGWSSWRSVAIGDRT